MPRLMLVSTAAMAFLSAGCTHKSQLQYDLGRASAAAFQAQADLQRTSAVDANYPMSGAEALRMRVRVTETTTDMESGEVEAVDTIEVK